MRVELRVILLVVILDLLCIKIAQATDRTPQQLVREARDQVKAVSIHDVKKMIDAREKLILLDVRDKEEFEKEHIPGAINISRGQLEFLVEDKIPDKDARIFVY
jgi:3-mercaptopyruvate sulfurtransferase SseA